MEFWGKWHAVSINVHGDGIVDDFVGRGIGQNRAAWNAVGGSATVRASGRATCLSRVGRRPCKPL
jgi:hypothetical protein